MIEVNFKDINLDEIQKKVDGFGDLLGAIENLEDKIYLTKVHHSFEGDTFFPELSSDWKEVNKTEKKADEKHKYNYDFITLERN